jgi:ABC-2 type transport system ATP-binding protein
LTVVLETKDLTKTLRGRRVVNSLNLEVNRGDVFGFLGPNGAGKTMTIRLMLGLIRPDSGRIFICGKDLEKNYPEAISQVGAIVEQPSFLNYLTGRQNLDIFAAMSGGVEDRRVEEVIDLVGMRNRIDSKVGTYSLGMKQRLGIAQSLLHRPQVVIYDEPTNGLDPQGMKEVRELIQSLAAEENLTVFVSTHLLYEVELMCNRVAVINRGTLLRQGHVKELLNEIAEDMLELQVDRPEAALEALHNSGLVREAWIKEELLLARIETGASPQVNRLLVNSGFELFSSTLRHGSLEELYLKLTGGEEIA